VTGNRPRGPRHSTDGVGSQLALLVLAPLGGLIALVVLLWVVPGSVAAVLGGAGRLLNDLGVGDVAGRIGLATMGLVFMGAGAWALAVGARGVTSAIRHTGRERLLVLATAIILLVIGVPMFFAALRPG